MNASALHPYRKRKFFYELAALLGEDPPRIQQFAERFPPAPIDSDKQGSTTAKAAEQHLTSSSHSQFKSSEVLNSSFAISEDDSIEYVEFDGLQDALAHNSVTGSRHGFASQGSVYESTQDSASLVPAEDSSISTYAVNRGRKQTRGFHFDFDAADGPLMLQKKVEETRSAPTTLVNSEIVSVGKPSDTPTELEDYYDCDRLCEITPCWVHKEKTQCELHKDDVACPMLLFCLQVMDEFVAYHSFQRQESWRVAACKLAQSVFVARWDAAVLKLGGRQEIDLHEYLLRKKTLAGVAYEVWRLVGMYWDKYKLNYLHQQELCFADDQVEHVSPESSKWSRMRDFFHVYGMKASQASRLAEVDHAFAQSEDYLSSKQLSELLDRSPHASPLRFGVNYLRHVRLTSSSSSAASKQHQQPIHRHVISQPEWKVAFTAIVIHLQKWIPDVQVFPCGSFSRGAAFGSTIDILVALPEVFPKERPRPRSSFEDVVAVLSSAKIVQKDSEHRVSANRSLFVVPYKKSVLMLDLKVHEQPTSWFALLYFTGPQRFAHDFYCSLLQMSLRELSEATFAAIYATAVDVLGLEKVNAVECEKDLFDLVGREYLLPSFRM